VSAPCLNYEGRLGLVIRDLRPPRLKVEARPGPGICDLGLHAGGRHGRGGCGRLLCLLHAPPLGPGICELGLRAGAGHGGRGGRGGARGGLLRLNQGLLLVHPSPQRKHFHGMHCVIAMTVTAQIKLRCGKV
jgi:hypothetical protein